MRIFETIKPTNELLERYISYYYVDIADSEDYFNEYICYPHYNNTISIYKNHTAFFQDQQSIISFGKDAKPLQIYTPLRENILKVTQRGPVYKIGIVFKPFGINQFLGNSFQVDQIQFSPTFKLINGDAMKILFDHTDFRDAIIFLEEQLIELFKPIHNTYIESAIRIFHQEDNDLNIDQIAEKKLGISRKQLNRLFTQYLGTSPQKYRSIVRFRQLMNYKLNTNTRSSNLTSLSHQVHYTDQSHFIKACKQLTGQTPSQFFKNGKIIGAEDTFWKFTE